MPQIKAFKALLYSDQLKSRMGTIVSPPYDVIDSKKQKALIDADELSSVRLCLADSSEKEDRYKMMSERLQRWKSEGILKLAPKPAFYLIEDRFMVGDTEKLRVGFVALMQVSPFEEKKVLPHEHTLKGPKVDRLELLKEMGAELSQIFLSYQDDDLVLENIYKEIKSTPPHFEFEDCMNVKRKLWMLTDESKVNSLSKLLAEREVLIADGHHRYETAIHYSRENPSPQAQHVQVYFTNTKSPGFEIYPIHRVTDLPPNLKLDQFMGELESRFEISKLSAEESYDDVLKKTPPSKLAFILSSKDSNFLLTRDLLNADDAAIFALQNSIFDEIFKWDLTKISKGLVQFCNSREEFDQAVSAGDQKVGFYLPATNLDLVMRLAQKGQRMPQKSTFFYPKLASGLVNYELSSFEEI